MHELCEICHKKRYAFRCRMCGRRLCVDHIIDGLCPPCWEKTTGKKYQKPTSGCFITEACIQAIGLPDNCPELQTLRQFRDNHLQKTKEGRKIIKEYYEIAPKIVEEIKRKPNSKEIFQEIFNNVRKIVKQIEQGNSETAITIYESTISQLKKKYLHNASIEL
ncbi:MAG: CFI-box-CTERM domain-containing protein [Candidatus Bathyarchaeia archaeon]